MIGVPIKQKNLFVKPPLILTKVLQTVLTQILFQACMLIEKIIYTSDFIERISAIT